MVESAPIDGSSGFVGTTTKGSTSIEAQMSTSPEPGSFRRFAASRHSWLVIVAGLFLVYNSNFREIGGSDTIPATLLPAAIVAQQSLTLDMFQPIFRTDEKLRTYKIFSGVSQVIDGRELSSYPVGGAILAAPVYAIPVWMGWLEEWQDYRIAAKVAVSLMVALSAGFLFLTLRRLVEPHIALFLSLAYALGTSAWSTASQGPWQHAPGMFTLSLGILLLQKLEERPLEAMGRYAAAAGAALAMAVVSRPLNIVPALLLALFVLLRHRRTLLAFGVPFASIGCCLVAYNVLNFGHLTGGYQAVYDSPSLRGLGLSPATAFSMPLLQGLASTLASPSKGLLIFSPFMLAGIAGSVAAWRDSEFPLGRYLVIWFFFVLVVLSKNELWWGGATYGPRYFSELMIPLTLMIGASWSWIASRLVVRALFGVAVAVSIGIQVIGAFYFPCGWDQSPKWVHAATDRLWDWRDTEISRCISEGRRRGTASFEFLLGPSHGPWVK